MATSYELELSRRFREGCARRLGKDLVEVRMYGSRARGDARPDSDLDLLVLTLTNNPDVREQVHTVAAEVALAESWPFTLQPQVMTVEHFQSLLAAERLYAQDIEAEGIPV